MFKKLFFYPPVLAAISATCCISIIAYLSEISNEYVLWMIPTFGASVVLITALPASPLARPRNIFFGHLLGIIVGILFNEIIGISFVSLGLAVGVTVTLMIYFKVIHPPAAANPLIALFADVSLEYILFPVIVGTLVIIFLSVIINKFILKRNYPKRWF